MPKTTFKVEKEHQQGELTKEKSLILQEICESLVCESLEGDQNKQSNEPFIIKEEIMRIQEIFESLCQNYEKCDPVVFSYIRELEKITNLYDCSLESLNINENHYLMMLSEISANAVDLLVRSEEKVALSDQEKKFLKEAKYFSFLFPNELQNLNTVANFSKTNSPGDYFPETSFSPFLNLG